MSQSWDGKSLRCQSNVGGHLEFKYIIQICLAIFPANGIWYRAEVVGVNEDRTVDIDFVDFGNKETIHFSGLMKIPEIFTRLPIQVMKMYR